MRSLAVRCFGLVENELRSRKDRVRVAAEPRKRAAKLWGLFSRFPRFLSALKLLKNRQATQANSKREGVKRELCISLSIISLYFKSKVNWQIIVREKKIFFRHGFTGRRKGNGP